MSQRLTLIFCIFIQKTQLSTQTDALFSLQKQVSVSDAPEVFLPAAQRLSPGTATKFVSLILKDERSSGYQ